MTSWMVVTSPDNLGRTSDLGFSIQGFKTRQRRKVLEQMRAGDNLVYYVSKAQAFGATARVESDGYEDHELIWQSKPGEDYPWRVKISPDVVLDEGDWIPSEAIGPGLEYVKKWPAEHWKLAFQGQLRMVSEVDAALLLGRMRERGGVRA